MNNDMNDNIKYTQEQGVNQQNMGQRGYHQGINQQINTANLDHTQPLSRVSPDSQVSQETQVLRTGRVRELDPVNVNNYRQNQGQPGNQMPGQLPDGTMPNSGFGNNNYNNGYNNGYGNGGNG